MNNNTRYYYTLKGLIPTFDLESVQTLITQEASSATTLDEKFSEVINILDDAYSKWYIGYVDKCFIWGVLNLPTTEEIEEVKVDFIKRLSIIYNFTKDRYLTLLNLYDNQKNNLMNKLNNVTTVTGDHRVNDTPQDAGTGHQNFTDDDHTSMWEGTNTTTTVDSDPMTIMARLDEIQRMYMNLLRDWVKEFRKLFIAPYNEIETPEGE